MVIKLGWQCDMVDFELSSVARSIGVSRYTCRSCSNLLQADSCLVAENVCAGRTYYVLPVLWMTSCFHIMDRTAATLDESLMHRVPGSAVHHCVKRYCGNVVCCRVMSTSATRGKFLKVSVTSVSRQFVAVIAFPTLRFSFTTNMSKVILLHQNINSCIGLYNCVILVILFSPVGYIFFLALISYFLFFFTMSKAISVSTRPIFTICSPNGRYLHEFS